MDAIEELGQDEPPESEEFLTLPLDNAVVKTELVVSDGPTMGSTFDDPHVTFVTSEDPYAPIFEIKPEDLEDLVFPFEKCDDAASSDDAVPYNDTEIDSEDAYGELPEHFVITEDPDNDLPTKVPENSRKTDSPDFEPTDTSSSEESLQGSDEEFVLKKRKRPRKKRTKQQKPAKAVLQLNMNKESVRNIMDDITKGSELNSCGVCSSTFASLPKLHAHMREKHATQQENGVALNVITAVKCRVQNCTHYFQFLQDLNKHYEKFHKLDSQDFAYLPNKCLECQVMFQYADQADQHWRIVHAAMATPVGQQAGLNCMYCDQRFGEDHLLQQHIRAEHREQNCCGSCGRFFIVRENFLRHTKVCDKIKELSKRQTSNGTSSKDNDTGTNDPKKQIVCQFCFDVFLTQSQLQNHFQSKHLIERHRWVYGVKRRK